MKRVVVIGAGAAGLIAAYSAAINNAEVTILEKNEKTGKKLYITGKGRCNLTNACESEDFFKNIITNPKFMYSSFYSFDNNSICALFENNGLRLKTERGLRVFPESDRSSDVINLLNKLLKNQNVRVCLNTCVLSIGENKVFTNRGNFEYDAVIIATGGMSYPVTGSNGDGYKFANTLGHKIKETKAALVPLNCLEKDPLKLQGLSLRNVSLKMYVNERKVFEDFGEMLFTHFGITGPLVLSASSIYAKQKNKDNAYVLIDMKPALSLDELDHRILRDFDDNMNKEFKNSLDKLLPKKMIPVVVERSGIDENKKVNEITREERQRLINILKNFKLTVTSSRGFDEAIITMGGIDVKEINPSTMESKIKENVYFAGEIIDVDALTGGFNLQIAWSTGYLAGLSAATQ